MIEGLVGEGDIGRRIFLGCLGRWMDHGFGIVVAREIDRMRVSMSLGLVMLPWPEIVLRSNGMFGAGLTILTQEMLSGKKFFEKAKLSTSMAPIESSRKCARG